MTDKRFVTIVNGGMDTRSVKFDEANIPSADQKAALVGPLGYTPAAGDPYITQQFFQDKKDSYSWQKAVNHGVHYIKPTDGAPIGTPAAGEKCLNTFNHTLYTESAGAWDVGVAISVGDRFAHIFTGSITNGDAGDHTKDNIIRTRHAAGYYTATPADGWAAFFSDEVKRRLYVALLTEWVVIDSLVSHNSLAELQGGDSVAEEYFHIPEDAFNALETANSPSTENPIATMADVSSGNVNTPVKYTFTWSNGLIPDQSHGLFASGDVVKQHVMPKPGKVIGVGVSSSHGRTAGSCAFCSVVNATVQDTFSATLDVTNTQYHHNYDGNIAFVAGDRLGAQFIANAAWESSEVANEESALVDLYVVFSDV